jgi:hypothetical protein
MLLNSYYDFVIRAQAGLDSISRVIVASDPIQVTPATLRLAGVIGTVAVHTAGDLRPQIVADADGIISVGIWRATYVPTSSVTYNTLGLVASSGLLIAALPVGTVTAAANDSVAIQWTIASRGKL